RVFVSTKDAVIDLGEIDLSGQSFEITGTIENGIPDPRFDTMAEVVSTSPRTDDGTLFGGFGVNRFAAPSGYPVGLSSTTARVQAVKRNVASSLNSLVNVSQFDNSTTRV